MREGTIPPERQVSLDGKMSQIGALLGDQSDEITDNISQADTARRLATELIPEAANPSLPKAGAPPPPTAAELKQRMADGVLQGAEDASMVLLIQEIIA